MCRAGGGGEEEEGGGRGNAENCILVSSTSSEDVSSLAAFVIGRWNDGMMGYVVTHPSPRISSGDGPSIRL
ncbi:hypothetical protein KOW79_017936 [Hemibagrus wyckioides]|uniref:Uncharacterized protein n=1 Tax=Hemibagrus wyckioides TaxID=337641 RepID=A0A9D3N8J2_9TELE|nr:hypothetical protein KOW79_017936 [Hemibagrus wyckioides]